jgi:hypothetical protein
MDRPGAGVFTAITETLCDVVTMSRNTRQRRLLRRAERIGDDVARLEDDLARLEEQLARERHRAWLAAVERQSREIQAGPASEAQARAALSGKRRNPLDERKFL